MGPCGKFVALNGEFARKDNVCPKIMHLAGFSGKRVVVKGNKYSGLQGHEYTPLWRENA
jgi:hypothetical protein